MSKTLEDVLDDGYDRRIRRRLRNSLIKCFTMSKLRHICHRMSLNEGHTRFEMAHDISTETFRMMYNTFNRKEMVKLLGHWAPRYYFKSSAGVRVRDEFWRVLMSFGNRQVIVLKLNI